MVITELQISENLGKQLQLIASRDIPFAVAKALTLTAKAAQSVVREHINDTFTIRKKSGGFASSIAVKPATKQSLTAEVYTMARFAALQQLGGIRLPTKGGDLAIPRYNNLGEVKQNRGARKLSDAFILPLSNGKQAIAQRQGKNLRILYFLKSQARIEKRFEMVEMTIQTVKNDFEKLFNLNNA